jgi:hypothetical protein
VPDEGGERAAAGGMRDGKEAMGRGSARPSGIVSESVPRGPKMDHPVPKPAEHA